jgi:hypothetical protein
VDLASHKKEEWTAIKRAYDSASRWTEDSASHGSVLGLDMSALSALSVKKTVKKMVKKMAKKISPAAGSLTWFRKEWTKALRRESPALAAEFLAQLSYENMLIRKRLSAMAKHIDAVDRHVVAHDEHLQMLDAITFQHLMEKGQEKMAFAQSECDCFSCVQAKLRNRES